MNISSQKITEIVETKFKTVREKDATGKKVAKQVPYKAYRTVNVVSGGKRFAHAFVDGIVYYVIYYFINFIYLHAISFDQNNLSAILGSFFIAMIFLFIFPLYYIVFEHFFQRTPGKFLTKAVVIDIYGRKPDIGTNFLRNIIRLVPFETLSCLNDRGWHDKWSDTFVVSEEEYAKISQLLSQDETGSEVEGVTIVKPVSSRLVKNIFLFVVFPLSIVLYVFILYKSFTSVDKTISSLGSEETKWNKTISEVSELSLIETLYNQGKIDEAQEKALRFTKKHENYYWAWTLLGHTYLDQGKLEEAIEAYKNGIKANKNAFEPHNGLGLVYDKKEEYEKALREYTIADSIKPNEALVMGNLASVYDNMGDSKRSIQFGIRSVQLDSNNATLSANLAYYYHYNNQFKHRNKMIKLTSRMGYNDVTKLLSMFYPDDVAKGYINITGEITGADEKKLEDVNIFVVNSDSIVIKETVTDKKGHYEFALPLNENDDYLVKVSYPGLTFKSYLISTKDIPDKEQKKKFPKLEANLGLSKKVEGVDYSFLNKPLNRYYYNPEKDNYEYDKALLESTLKKWKQMKADEEKIQK